MKPSPAATAPTPDRLMQFAWGFAVPLVIEAAVRHRVFDLLDPDPRSVEELAQFSGSSVRGLTAICDALVSVELLAREGKRYALTPESSAFLVSSRPAYHGGFFAHISTQLLPNWLKLDEVVRTGRPALAVNDEAEGAEFFARFVEAIFPLSYAAATKFGEHFGLARTTAPVSVLDVGAGSGVWGVALARQSPHVHVRALDWPPVLEVTGRIARRFGVGDQFKLVPGNFRESDWGGGHQIVAIGHILHSEGRELSRRLLKKAFNALVPGGTVAIMEFIVNDDRTGPPASLLFAVNMLVNTEAGDSFTFAEMSDWLRQAGFTNPRLLDVPAVSPLILANKP